MSVTGRKPVIAIATTAVLGIGLIGAVLPASAQQETVTLTLLNGQHVTLTLNVPAGTPTSALPLPKLSSPVVGITVVSTSSSPVSTPGVPGPPPVTLGGGGDGGAAGHGGSSTPAGAPGAGVSGPTPSSAPSGTANGAPQFGSQQAQATTGSATRRGSAAGAAGRRAAAKKGVVAKPKATPVRASNGLPTALNPTLTVAQLGPVSVGVPNFFIDKFRIPPFLIPIYQAAGVEYDVPWQVLAAVNEIETDYGRNLSVSSAGAEGWMQFLPATWKVYGVDANGDGVKDPYNPVDAIFAAARYLNAAGAAKDLRSAIFAYNHANWYVDSVMLRAKLIGGLPEDLVASISGLTQGRFPVLAKSRYADDPVEARHSATGHAKRAKSAAPTSVSTNAVNIYAKSGAPVVAVQDGVIVAMGSNAKLGNFVRLRDAAGNTYIYSQLKKLASTYPQPKPHAQLSTAATTPSANKLRLPGLDPTPVAPASDGFQGQQGGPPPLPGAAPAAPSQAAPAADSSPPPTGSLAPERLFAHPLRPAAYAAGGKAQLAGVLGLRASDVSLSPLRKGAHVTAGTVLGRIGKSSPVLAPHLTFQVRPAGKNAPLIDPKPILDGWKLLESTAIYRAAAQNPLVDAKVPTIGQVLLESKDQLQQRVLSDPNLAIYPCGRRDIETGVIDRRVLATLEFLSGSGLKPTVSALKCGHPAPTPGLSNDAASGSGVDLSKINGIPIVGHQGAGTIADITVRRLLTLQGSFKPQQIVSLMQYPGVDNTVAMQDHADRVHVGFSPAYDPGSKLGRQIAAALKPKQWQALVARLGQTPSPAVSPQPSRQAIPDAAAPTPAG